MAKKPPMRANIDLEVCGEEVSFDIDWRIIEIVERTFGAVADLVASDVLVRNPTRYQVADVIIEWIRGTNLKKSDVRQYVMTASQEELQTYIGAIQGAVLYSLSYIDEEQLDLLTQGQDLPDEEEEGEEENPT